MCFVTVPHPLGMISKEEVNAKVDAAFDDIVKAATAWTPSKEKQDAQVKPYPAKRFKFSGTYADVNDMFQKRKWSLSLPIVPPTVDKVAAMLKGTKRNPAEVLWVVPPRQGMLTVELVAALGVMAGAKPEHMPLLIATVEAMADPVAAWRGPTTTTAATVPVFFISGPIIDKLKLNPGTGTAGGENPVTNALGYFVNLVGDVVGGSVPPNFDKSTHGSSADLVAMVFTENAKENPWKTTYAEEAGFKPGDSIVTHFSAYLGNANIDPYQYLETMTATNSASIAKSSVIINGQNVPYTSVPDLIPDDITWVKVTTYNIGLDLDLFNNRLSFTGDYYRRNTTDLYTVGPNLPQVLGSAAPYGNYASLKTKGWGVSLGWRDSFKLGGKPFNYSLRAMLWDSRSWITDYYNETGDLTTYYKGMEIGEIWGFRTAGIYASNAEALNGPAYNFFKNGEMFRAYAGDLRFVDVDGDGIMTKGNRTLSNHGDMEIIGNQSPRYQYSINMSLNWNGIGLSMLWQGVGKRDWYPWTESGFFWGKWNRAYNSLMKTQTGDRVVKIDKSTDNWRVTNMDKNPYWTRMVSLAANRNDGPLTWENDHYLQDASYIRLKNITVDYTFPKHICKKLRIEGLKIYVSGENLFTHSPMFKYTDMFDPEVITSGDSDFASTQKSGLGGTGNGYSYPMLKTVTLGVNVTF